MQVSFVLPTRFELISMVPETIILSIELREQIGQRYKIDLNQKHSLIHYGVVIMYKFNNHYYQRYRPYVNVYVNKKYAPAAN